MKASQRAALTVARLRTYLLALLWGSMVVLALEVRFEHQAILTEKWPAWMPIGYCIFLCIAIPICTMHRSRTSANVLAALFAGLSLIGLAGEWFHAGPRPSVRISALAQTVQARPGELVSTEDDSGAPFLAPLALLGLGAIGVCAALLPSTEHE